MVYYSRLIGAEVELPKCFLFVKMCSIVTVGVIIIVFCYFGPPTTRWRKADLIRCVGLLHDEAWRPTVFRPIHEIRGDNTTKQKQKWLWVIL